MARGVKFTAQDKKELSRIMTKAWQRKRGGKVSKITEGIDKLEGVEKSYWDGEKKKLTMYYDEKYTARQIGVRVGDYLARRQLQHSVEEIKLISTPKGTFRKGVKARAKARRG